MALAWWPAVFDFFGFYLLLLPLAVYLHNLLKPEAPEWMALFSIAGLGYILFGAMGAATLAVIFSSQAAAYAAADSGMAQQMHKAIFEAFGDAIQRGVWGILDPILRGVDGTGPAAAPANNGFGLVHPGFRDNRHGSSSETSSLQIDAKLSC